MTTTRIAGSTAIAPSASCIASSICIEMARTAAAG
jgi:hypothetical protein